VSVVALVACGGAPSVSQELQQAFAHAKTGDELRLGELAPFAWERLFVFGPYTRRASAEAVLGFEWPEIDRYGIDVSDAFFLMVFVGGTEVVHAEKHPRCAPDFAEQGIARPLDPDDVLVYRELGRCPIVRVQPHRMGPARAGSGSQ